MKVIFSELVKLELDDAVAYYELEHPGLGINFKSEVRKTENFEENYIRGKYGAVPFLGDFDNFINSKMLLPHENEG